MADGVRGTAAAAGCAEDRRPAGAEFACSVVIPCRNERATVADAVARTPQMGGRTELVFVVGGSTDGTAEEVTRCAAAHPDRDVRLVAQIGSGKGAAVRQGFWAARGRVLMILDGDLTVAPEDLPRFYEAVSRGGVLASGCRMALPMAKGAMRFLNRLGNRVFARLLSSLTGQPIRDALCGTKALLASDYRRMSAHRDALSGGDPFGDFGLLLGSAALGLEIAEVPVRYAARVYGRSQIRRFRHGWALFRLCWRAWSGKQEARREQREERGQGARRLLRANDCEPKK